MEHAMAPRAWHCSLGWAYTSSQSQFWVRVMEVLLRLYSSPWVEQTMTYFTLVLLSNEINSMLFLLLDTYLSFLLLG